MLLFLVLVTCFHSVFSLSQVPKHQLTSDLGRQVLSPHSRPTSSPHPQARSLAATKASLVGDVALTTVTGTPTQQNGQSTNPATPGTLKNIGEDIFGPFEAGFGTQQDTVITNQMGCSTTTHCYSEGGADVTLAQAMCAHNCGVTLPRTENNIYYGFLDSCGGHTQAYHFHKNLNCLYTDSAGSAHSAAIAETVASGAGACSPQGNCASGQKRQCPDGAAPNVGQSPPCTGGPPSCVTCDDTSSNTETAQLLYGKYEQFANNQQLPVLDACNGHFGRTPESPNVDVYHYHTTDAAPFTIGCYGPNTDQSLVTTQQCRDLYSDCQEANDAETNNIEIITVTGENGQEKQIPYQMWCPCFDKSGLGLNGAGLNVGTALATRTWHTRVVSSDGVWSDGSTGTIGELVGFENGITIVDAAASTAGKTCANTDGNNSPATCGSGFTANAGTTSCTTCANDGTECCTATTTSPATPNSTTPNFLVFQPDDLSYYWADAPIHPSKNTANVNLPHLNKLRSESAVFTRAYATSPMCAPSRYSVLTGRYPSRSKYAQDVTLSCDASNTVVDVQVPKTKLDEEQTKTLATTLKTYGYMTGTVGKWHVSVEGASPWLPTSTAYELQTMKAKETGFDFADGFYIGNMDNSCTASKCKDTLGFSHNMEWVTAKAMDFIQSAHDASKPFFLYFNPTVPHSPDVEEALNEIDIRQTPSGTLSSDPVTGMPARSDLLTRANAEPGQLSAAISALWIDDSMGALYAKLDTLNILDDTLIVFVMDHGALGKSTLYETGTRIAMFARYPNGDASIFSAGTEHETLVSNMDLAPTFLHLASGHELNTNEDQMDGRSLLTEVASQNDGQDRTLFMELNKDRAVVTTKFKYIRRGLEEYSATGANKCQDPGIANQANPYPFKSDATQLYDLTSDNSEQSNVAASAAHSQTVSDMSTALECHVDRTRIGSVDFVRDCDIGGTAPSPSPQTTGGTPSPQTNTGFAPSPESTSDSPAPETNTGVTPSPQSTGDTPAPETNTGSSPSPQAGSSNAPSPHTDANPNDPNAQDGGTNGGTAAGNKDEEGQETPAGEINNGEDEETINNGEYGAIAGGSVGCCLLVVGALVLAKRRGQSANNTNGKGSTAVSSDSAGRLPPGWSMFVDTASGHQCYLNDTTGLTQWEHPSGGAGGGGIEMCTMENPFKKQGGQRTHERASTQPEQLPEGWDKHDDDDGNRYYSEQATGLTQWNVPGKAVGV